MPVTVIATVGAADSNSYATVAEADAYHANRLFADAWLDATADEKAQALIMATALIDAHHSWAGDAAARAQGKKVAYVWTGSPVDATQALCWPRTGMYTRNGFAISSTTIPQQLKDAVSEFARQLLSGDRTLDNDVITQGITSLSAGPVSLSFKDEFVAQVVPDAVMNLLVPSWRTVVVSPMSVFKVV